MSTASRAEPNRYRQIFLSVIVAVLAALGLTFFYGLLCWGALSLDPAPARGRVQALAAGSGLTETSILPLGGRIAPAWGGNDCLILSMLVLPPNPDPLRQLLSPPIPARFSPTVMTDPSGGYVPGGCLRLIELTSGQGEPDAGQPYDRYLHGQRLVAALLLRIMPAELMRGLIVTLTLGVFAGLSFVASRRAVRRRQAGDSRWVRDQGMAWVAGCLLFVYGLPLMAWWFSHALADLAIGAVLWAFWIADDRFYASGLSRAVLLAGAGFITAVFELLTGGLPLTLAILILLQMLRPWPGSCTRSRLSALLVDTAAVLAAFLVGFLLPTVAKQLLLIFSAPQATAYGDALLHRLWGPVLPEMSPRELSKLAVLGLDPTWLDTRLWFRGIYAAVRLAYFGYVTGYGSAVLGTGLLAVAFGTWLAQTARSLRAAAVDTRMAGLLALAAGLAILGWWVLFLNHTLLHALWMVRIGVVFPMAAGLLLQTRSNQRA